MNKEKAIELLHSVVEYMLVGEKISNVIKQLKDIGFSNEDLSHFFDEEDILNSQFYYDIHVSYGQKDSDGYSIFIACDTEDSDEVIKIAINDNRFEFIDDVSYIDYVHQISLEEYNEATK